MRLRPLASVLCVFSDRTLRWTVTRRLRGVPIDARYETWQGCPYDEREFGDVLHGLHGIEPSGWGPIDDHGDALFDSWPSFLVGAARSALRTARERDSVTAEV